MTDFIIYEELEKAIESIYKYLTTGDRIVLESTQQEIHLANEIDFSITTKAEYKEKVNFIEESHGIKRMAIFLLNYYGEMYLDDGTLTIFNDDLSPTMQHTNTYILKLKDKHTHLKLYKGNPQAKDKPYDFNTEFISQLTFFTDTSETVDTTSRAYDSFVRKYTKPSRTLDFKGALWNPESNNDTHDVDYIIQLCSNGELKLYNRRNQEEKNFKFTESDPSKQVFYNKYFELLSKLNLLKHYSWDNFFITATDKNN